MCGFLLLGLVFPQSLTAVTLDEPAKARPAATVDEHVVKRGEALWGIAQRYNTSVGEIMELNNLPSHDLKEGSKLRIPRRSKDDPRQVRQQSHTVQPGQTFWSVAEAYGVDAEDLARANPDVNPNRMKPDSVLIIPSREASRERYEAQFRTAASAPAAPASSRPPAAGGGPAGSAGGRIHTIATGETYYSIAKKYGLPVDAITAANPGLKPERLQTGLKIQLPPVAPPATAKPKAPAPPPGTGSPPTTTNSVRFSRHTVGNGETMSSIARKYQVSPDALLKRNRMEPDDKIFVGDVLTVPLPPAVSTDTPPVAPPMVVKKTPPPAPAPVVSPERPTPKPTPTPAPASVASSPPRPTPKPEAAPTPPPAPRKPAPPARFTRDADEPYVVKDGENENTIAQAFGVSKQVLYRHNRLEPGTRLRAGDEIMIPPAK